MKLPTLYTKDGRSNLRSWTIEYGQFAYGEEDPNDKLFGFRTTEGTLLGTQRTSEWTMCVGKNEGRANATTDAEQARLEAESRWRKRVEKGGVEVAPSNGVEPTYAEVFAAIEAASRTRKVTPMLAHKFHERKHRVTYPVMVQPKLDGIRVLFYLDGDKVVAMSRNQKPIGPSVAHICAQLAHVFALSPNLVLDGELYNHDLKDEFEEIISLVRKQEASDRSCALIQFHCYDCFRPNIDEPFRRRIQTVIDLVPAVGCTQTVNANTVDDESQIHALHEAMVVEGYEGLMIREENGFYEQRRSNTLLKLKTFEDDEFELIEVLPGRGGHATRAAKAVLKTSAGVTFEAGVIGTADYASRLLQAPSGDIKGLMATVKYQGFTKEGRPRFAKMKTIRNYE